MHAGILVFKQFTMTISLPGQIPKYNSTAAARMLQPALLSDCQCFITASNSRWGMLHTEAAGGHLPSDTSQQLASNAAVALLLLFVLMCDWLQWGCSEGVQVQGIVHLLVNLANDSSSDGSTTAAATAAHAAAGKA
jgi:hypothetical protein